MVDCLIIGGGVVGLSLAYELAFEGLRVEVLDRQTSGKEASWAGAGILPPVLARPLDPVDQLRALSHELHPQWAAALRDETGIDTGYRECGGIYLARSVGEAAALAGLANMFREVGIEIHALSPAELARHEPALQPVAESQTLRAAYLTPGESQLRNPHHMAALVAACRKRGVVIHDDVEARQFEVKRGGIRQVTTSAGSFTAGCYCVTAGPWTYQLLRRLDVESGILPVRGQMVLFRCPERPFSRVINEGPRYLVPRDDGRVLVGSTEEEVGFDKGTTAEAIAELQSFAMTLIPGLQPAQVEKSWAGLRPGTFDGLPYLGRLPELDNAFVAAGHFRSGLHLSPATAVVMSQLIRGEQPQIDLSPFQVCRGAASVRSTERSESRGSG